MTTRQLTTEYFDNLSNQNINAISSVTSMRVSGDASISSALSSLIDTLSSNGYLS